MTPPVDSKLVDKIKALLNIAGADIKNENECANASSLAQKLLMEHNLSMADVLVGSEQDNKPEAIIQDEIELQLNSIEGVEWRTSLAGAVARGYNCECLYKRHRRRVRIFFIGAETDLAICKDVYAWLSEQIWHLQENVVVRWNKGLIDADCSRGAYRRSFLMGCVETIESRLSHDKAQMRKDYGEKCEAIILRAEALVEAKVKELHPKVTTHNQREYKSYNGYADGRRAGRNVDIGRGRKLTASSHLLGE